MITSKSEYLYYLEADRIANGVPKRESLINRIKVIILPNYIWKFQKTLRKLEYIRNCKKGVFGKIQLFFFTMRYRRLSYKLGFSIPYNVFGPGLSIAHYGTIVINRATRIGANCRIHTSVNIGTEAGYGGKAPKIGDNCYIGPGSQIYGAIELGNNIAIGANSVVNKSFKMNDITLAGVPAKVIGEGGSKGIIIPATKIIELGLEPDRIKGLPAKEVFDFIKEFQQPI